VSDWEDFKAFAGLFKRFFAGWGKWFVKVASKGIREDLMIRQRERNRQQASGQEKRKAAIAKQRQKMREQRQREEAEMSEEERSLRSELHQARIELRALQKQRGDIDKFARPGIDFGPDMSFFPAALDCIEQVQGPRNVSVCLFYAAFHYDSSFPPDDPEGNVLYGWWQGFNEDFSAARFMQGSPCELESKPGTLVKRGMELALECGPEEALSEVEERSSCLHVATLTTPCACSTSKHAELSAQLKQLTDARNALAATLSGGQAGAAKAEAEATREDAEKDGQPETAAMGGASDGPAFDADATAEDTKDEL